MIHRTLIFLPAVPNRTIAAARTSRFFPDMRKPPFPPPLPLAWASDVTRPPRKVPSCIKYRVPFNTPGIHAAENIPPLPPSPIPPARQPCLPSARPPEKYIAPPKRTQSLNGIRACLFLSPRIPLSQVASGQRTIPFHTLFDRTGTLWTTDTCYRPVLPPRSQP